MVAFHDTYRALKLAQDRERGEREREREGEGERCKKRREERFHATLSEEAFSLRLYPSYTSSRWALLVQYSLLVAVWPQELFKNGASKG